MRPERFRKREKESAAASASTSRSRCQSPAAMPATARRKRCRVEANARCQTRCRRCGTDRKSTRLNSSHLGTSYAVFCLKKKIRMDKFLVVVHGTSVSIAHAREAFHQTNLYVAFHFFFNDTATTEIYTLSLHDALPIWHSLQRRRGRGARDQHGLQARDAVERKRVDDDLCQDAGSADPQGFRRQGVTPSPSLRSCGERVGVRASFRDCCANN